MTNNRLIGIALVAAVPLSLTYWQIAPNDFINPAWLQILYGYGIGFALTLMIMALRQESQRIDGNSPPKSSINPCPLEY